jgi:hypothetical protein
MLCESVSAALRQAVKLLLLLLRELTRRGS